MDAIKNKWNRIYKKDSGTGSIAAVLLDHTDLLPRSGNALDIACGRGGNALFLAERGMEVDAWDISDVVIKTLEHRHPRLHPKVLDISASALANLQYDLILTCHYLDASLAEAIRRATKPGGLIIYQTFTAEKRAAVGPSNPDFLLKHGQLEALVEGCQTLAFRDGSAIIDEKDPLAGRAYIVARKPADG